MTKHEADSENIGIKCPNPECGLVLHSKYHTICPRCAEPFPLEMLHSEKSESGNLFWILLILAGAVIAGVLVFFLLF